jgi:hypothetical protein
MTITAKGGMLPNAVAEITQLTHCDPIFRISHERVPAFSCSNEPSLRCSKKPGSLESVGVGVTVDGEHNLRLRLTLSLFNSRQKASLLNYPEWYAEGCTMLNQRRMRGFLDDQTLSTY